MDALTEIFFGNPLRRMAQSWSSVYQHYEDFWRFRLANPGANYRHYLRARRHRQHHQHKHAQSRTDNVPETTNQPEAKIGPFEFY